MDPVQATGTGMTDGTSNRDYYQRREAQEREAADAAREPMVRDIHFELARRYRELGRVMVLLQA